MSYLDTIPPKYRKTRYNGQSIHRPDYGDTSIRAMAFRMAKRLEEQKLSEAGVQSFGAWLRRLVWDESMWLATATYAFRNILLDHLTDVFREYSGMTRDKQLIEDALYAELRKLSDELNLGYVPQRSQHLSAVPA